MKNGIILIEYIEQLLAEGRQLIPAHLHAGRVRFRPILMTWLAAILGLFRLAIDIGVGPSSSPGAPDPATARHRRNRRPAGQHALHADDDSGGLSGARQETCHCLTAAAEGFALPRPQSAAVKQ